MGRQHITEISIMQMLHKFFSDGMFSWCSWLLQSLGLTPLNFYVWGCDEENVYKNSPYTLPELRQYSALHFNYHWTNSSSHCLKHKPMRECMHYWAWVLTILHTTCFQILMYLFFFDKHISKQWVIQHGPRPGSWKTMIYSLGLECVDNWLHFIPLNAGKGAEVF